MDIPINSPLRPYDATKISSRKFRRYGRIYGILSGMKLDNPFLTRGYAGPEYFCDRAAETRQLVSAISNGRDVTLVAPRRYGKTGLIHNAFQILEKDHATVYLDIFAVEDLTSFVQTFATAVLDRERHQCGRRAGVDANHDLGSFAGAELNPLDRNR